LITDNSCGYRALFLGIKYHELEVKNNSRDTQWRSLTRSSERQKAGAEQLMDSLQEWLVIKRQEVRERIESREYIPTNETLEEGQVRRQREYDRRYHAFQVERGEELPNEEEENEYLFNIEFNFETPMDISIVSIFQKYFGTVYQIVALNYRTGDQLFVGPDSDKQIYLLFSPGGCDGEGHWDLIKEMTSYRRTAYYCIKCNVAYQTPINHRCRDGCKFCRHHTPCISEEIPQHCNECNKTFVNIECFERHIENKVCKYIKVCELCEARYTKCSKEHVCGELKCRNCSEYYTEQPHYCFLKKLDQEKLNEEDSNSKIFVSFDIESMLL
jgi:hypothetical protein